MPRASYAEKFYYKTLDLSIEIIRKFYYKTDQRKILLLNTQFLKKIARVSIIKHFHSISRNFKFECFIIDFSSFFFEKSSETVL